MRASRGAVLLPAALIAVLATPATASADLGSTTTVNGHPPPGTMAPLSGIAVMLDTLQTDGNRLLVQQGVRKPGTRAPSTTTTSAATPAC